MARILNLDVINREKIELLNIARNADKSLLVTSDETRDVIRKYIAEELSFFSDESIRFRKLELEDIIAKKLSNIENNLLSHIENKITKMTEEIIRKSKERIIEAEVNKRVDEKLQKLRELL